MIRIVLDTNVVVSALFSPSGSESRVLRLGLHRLAQIYVSPPILSEYERVLASPKFGFSRSPRTIHRARDCKLRTLGTPAKDVYRVPGRG